MLGERTAARFAPANEADEKRDALVVKAIMKRLLTGMERLHSLGIVHRDIKPDNIMVTAEGEVRGGRGGAGRGKAGRVGCGSRAGGWVVQGCARAVGLDSGIRAWVQVVTAA